MNFFIDGLQAAWEQVVSGNPALWFIVKITLKVVLYSTLIGLVIGLPAGLVLGVGRFRGRGVLLVLANVGLGLPPVVVGLVLALLMFSDAPLGSLRLLFTLKGVYVAQSLLATPVIVALTASAVRDIPQGVLNQARAFGAGRLAVALLALREARIGVLAAIIAAVGSGLSEVGAVVLVGGNIVGTDQTLASAALQLVSAGDFAGALAVGIVLMALILIVTAALTWLQYGGRQRGRLP